MHLLLRVSNYSSSLIQLQYAYMAQDNDTSSSFTVLPVVEMNVWIHCYMDGLPAFLEGEE